jgi:RNA 2',3'-cyclic 3'-phosphodiesterase
VSPRLESRGPAAREAEDRLRTFFAVWPDASARDALAPVAREVAGSQGRAQPSRNLHLTLAFLGDVAATRVPALSAIGLAAAAAVSPFQLTLDHTGNFRRTGIAWVGASTQPPELAELVRQLRDALEAEGYAMERRVFQPHVTLARRCRGPVTVPLVTPIAWHVGRIALNASELARGGSRYRELATWPLGPRTADDRVGDATGTC